MISILCIIKYIAEAFYRAAILYVLSCFCAIVKWFIKHLEPQGNRGAQKNECLTWSRFTPHQATFSPAAATACIKVGSNLRSLKEHFVTQYLQSGTVYRNPSFLTFCVSLLLNLCQKLIILILLIDNEMSLCPYLRLFTIEWLTCVTNQLTIMIKELPNTLWWWTNCANDSKWCSKHFLMLLVSDRKLNEYWRPVTWRRWCLRRRLLRAKLLRTLHFLRSSSWVMSSMRRLFSSLWVSLLPFVWSWLPGFHSAYSLVLKPPSPLAELR